jgi:hypothetical protein
VIPLQHRAAQAMEKLANARSPVEKHEARQEGLAVHAALEKHIADEAFKAAFKAAQPQSMIGVWKDTTVRDRPVFMVRVDGRIIHGPVELADGSKVVATQGIIPVPMPMVPAMVARGWKRANSVTTPANIGMRDPVRSNDT